MFSLTAPFALAHPHFGQILINGHTHEPQTEIIPLNKMMGLEKTTTFPCS
jgi:UDP-2,3-diacylglucosamine pyrophosphatase LpxH